MASNKQNDTKTNQQVSGGFNKKLKSPEASEFYDNSTMASNKQNDTHEKRIPDECIPALIPMGRGNTPKKPVKCPKKCETRPMMGQSWWKQMGYNSPCSCAHDERDRDIGKLTDLLRRNGMRHDKKVTGWLFNMRSHYYALQDTLHRDIEWRKAKDAEEFMDCVTTGVALFGEEVVRPLIPKSVKLKYIDEAEYEQRKADGTLVEEKVSRRADGTLVEEKFLSRMADGTLVEERVLCEKEKK